MFSLIIAQVRGLQTIGETTGLAGWTRGPHRSPGNRSEAENGEQNRVVHLFRAATVLDCCGSESEIPSYLIDSITITSPWRLPRTRTVIGLRSVISWVHTLLPFTISTIRVLLGSSKRTYRPSGLNSPNVVVVTVTGHSTTFLVVSVLVVVEAPFSSRGVVLVVSLCSVCVV